jgi:Ca-activated chloride channel family protein
MNTDIKLSTRFHQAQGAHEVGVLVTLAGETPARRPRINIALVLDRSGSMAGAPLDAAKEAARRFTGFLSADDRVTLVAFDDQVRVLGGPGAVDHDRLAAAIHGINPGGSTNLSGGWLTSRTHVQSGLGDGTNRVVLLTDGQANAGIVEPPQLTGLARGALEARVSTTCIGFGADFNEDLLGAMAAAGGGNYWYVEHIDQMGDIFSQEIEGLVALAAQNLTIEVRATHDAVHGVTFPQSFAIPRTAEGAWSATLGDLYATAPRNLGIIFHVDDLGALGQIRVAEVRVTADVMVAEGVEHRTIVMPVVANIDGTDAIEPVVEVTLRCATPRPPRARRRSGPPMTGGSTRRRRSSRTRPRRSQRPATARSTRKRPTCASRLPGCAIGSMRPGTGSTTWSAAARRTRTSWLIWNARAGRRRMSHSAQMTVVCC